MKINSKHSFDVLLSQISNYAANALRHRSSALYVTSLGLSRFASFVLALVALRVFNVGNYAIYVKIFSVQPLIQSLAGSGINELLIPILHSSGFSVSQNKLDIAKEHLLPMAILLLICFSIASPLLLASVAKNRLLAIICLSYILYGLSYFLLNSESIYSNLSFSRSKASLINLINNVIVPSGALALAAWHNNPFIYPLFLFVLSALSILVLSSAYLCKANRLHLPNGFRVGNPHTTKIFSYSLVGSIASWSSGFGILYLASFLYQPAELQVFGTIFSLSSIPGVVSTLLNQAWVPYLYRSFDAKSVKESIKMSGSFYRKLSILMIALIIILLVSLHSILEVLVGITLKDNSLAFAIYSSALLSASYLASIGWYFNQNYFYLLSKVKSLNSILALSSLIPFLLFCVAKNFIYLPSAIFFCQAFLRSLSSAFLNRRIAPFMPQVLETITPSLALFTILLLASPVLEHFYG
jgi:hypothetical protein